MVEWTENDLAAYKKRLEQTKPKQKQKPKGWFEIYGMVIEESTDQGKLNKTERAFWEFLKRRRHSWIGVHCMTLKLADDCRYTPDFWSIDKGKLTAYEVKGFFRDDAKVKIKVAARLFPWIEFMLVRKNKLRSFDYEMVKP